MKKNVGSLDKTIRIIGGIALLSLIYFLESPMNYFGLIGLVPLITATLGICPLYSILGVSTCPIQNSEEK